MLDAHMPGMDGFSVAEEIKKDPALAGATRHDADFRGTAWRRGPLPCARGLPPISTSPSNNQSFLMHYGDPGHSSPEIDDRPGLPMIDSTGSNATTSHPFPPRKILFGGRQRGEPGKRMAIGILGKRGHLSNHR